MLEEHALNCTVSVSLLLRISCTFCFFLSPSSLLHRFCFCFQSTAQEGFLVNVTALDEQKQSSPIPFNAFSLGMAEDSYFILGFSGLYRVAFIDYETCSIMPFLSNFTPPQRRPSLAGGTEGETGQSVFQVEQWPEGPEGEMNMKREELNYMDFAEDVILAPAVILLACMFVLYPALYLCSKSKYYAGDGKGEGDLCCSCSCIVYLFRR